MHHRSRSAGGNHLAASDPVRISAASGAGNVVPMRTASPRLGSGPLSAPRRRRQPPRAPPQPPTGRISCPEDLDAHSRSHPARPRPFDPKPAPALLGRAGSHAGRRPARAATLFRVLRPMRCAREQREKLTSGDFYNHVRLRFLPCRRARAACDSRDARHATGAGLRA